MIQTSLDPVASCTSRACCEEFARISRRGLFAGAVALAGASTAVGTAVVTTSPAYAATADAVLVVLSLRGAADGLSLVVPHADPVYYQARPRIAIPSERLLAKDAMFGLHPQLSALLPLWTSGRLAAVHATGLPAPNRSHFAAMEELEDAVPGTSVRQGWLNRLIGTDSSRSPLQAFNASGGVHPDLPARRRTGDVGLRRRIGAHPRGRRVGRDRRSPAVAPHDVGRQPLTARPGDALDLQRPARLRAGGADRRQLRTWLSRLRPRARPVPGGSGRPR